MTGDIKQEYIITRSRLVDILFRACAIAANRRRASTYFGCCKQTTAQTTLIVNCNWKTETRLIFWKATHKVTIVLLSPEFWERDCVNTLHSWQSTESINLCILMNVTSCRLHSRWKAQEEVNLEKNELVQNSGLASLMQLFVQPCQVEQECDLLCRNFNKNSLFL